MKNTTQQSVHIASAPNGPAYSFTGAVDDEWTNLKNWSDANGNSPALALPDSSSTILIIDLVDTIPSGIQPVLDEINVGYWDAPGNGSGNVSGQVGISLTGPANFYVGSELLEEGSCASQGGHILGNCNFNQTTLLSGQVVGNVMMDEDSSITPPGEVYGSCIFNSNSRHRGYLKGEANFYSDSKCIGGMVCGNVTMHNDSEFGTIANGGATISCTPLGFTPLETDTCSYDLVLLDCSHANNATVCRDTYITGPSTNLNCPSFENSTTDRDLFLAGPNGIARQCTVGRDFFMSGGHTSQEINVTGHVTTTGGYFGASSQIQSGPAGAVLNFTASLTDTIISGASYSADTTTSTIFGSATLLNSENNGIITGNVAFTGSSLNNTSGIVNGIATFSNTSHNEGTIDQGAAFYNTSENQFGSTVGGDAFFHGNSNNGGQVTGSMFFYDDSNNDATITKSPTFNGNSSNNGIITGDPIFHTSSKNKNAGTIIGNPTFNETSHNDSLVTGNAAFHDDSSNRGIINGNAIFNDSSYNACLLGSVTGTATYNGLTGYVSPYYYVLGQCTNLDASGNGFWNSTYYYLGNVFVPTSQIFTGSINGDWNNIGNWKPDASLPLLAGRLPLSTEDVELWASVTTNGGNQPTVTNSYIHTAPNLTIAISLTVTGTATFGYGSSNTGTITGNATFNSNSTNSGTITGNATFNDTSDQLGTVTGTTTCNTSGTCP